MQAEYPLIKKAWLHGFLDGFAPTAFLRPPKFRPLRYPHSFKDDLDAIGSDMWCALDKEDERREDLKSG